MTYIPKALGLNPRRSQYQAAIENAAWLSQTRLAHARVGKFLTSFFSTMPALTQGEHYDAYAEAPSRGKSDAYWAHQAQKGGR